MPQNEGQLGHLLPLLAQFEQRALPRLGSHHLCNPLQHAPVFVTDRAITVLAHHGHGPVATSVLRLLLLLLLLLLLVLLLLLLRLLLLLL